MSPHSQRTPGQTDHIFFCSDAPTFMHVCYMKLKGHLCTSVLRSMILLTKKYVI
jgi:hypothetical protein